MLEVETPYDLAAYEGKTLGTSDWLTVTQDRIDAFAKVSGDYNWIHVDVERAAREMPGGKTIAHGMLTFALLAEMGHGICLVKHRLRGVNYGSNKARFTAPVPCGSRIRLHRSVAKYEPVEGGARITYSNLVEVEGNDRPALVAETITMMYARKDT